MGEGEGEGRTSWKMVGKWQTRQRGEGGRGGGVKFAHSDRSDGCSGSIGGLKGGLRWSRWSSGARRKEVEEFFQAFYILVIFRLLFFSFLFYLFFVQDSSGPRSDFKKKERKKRNSRCLSRGRYIKPSVYSLKQYQEKSAPFNGRQCFVAPFTFLEEEETKQPPGLGGWKERLSGGVATKSGQVSEIKTYVLEFQSGH